MSHGPFPVWTPQCAGSWGHGTRREDSPYAPSIPRAAGERSQRMRDAAWTRGICVPTAGRTFSGATGRKICSSSIRSPSISVEPGNLKNSVRWHLTARVLDPSESWEASEGQGPLLRLVRWRNHCGHSLPCVCGPHRAQTWRSAGPQTQGPRTRSPVHRLTRFYTCTWVCCAANTPLAPAHTPGVLSQRELCDPTAFLGLEGERALCSTLNPSPEPTECPSMQCPWESSV